MNSPKLQYLTNDVINIECYVRSSANESMGMTYIDVTTLKIYT